MLVQQCGHYGKNVKEGISAKDVPLQWQWKYNQSEIGGKMQVR